MLLANFNGKEHLRHRAVSLRQHGFLVKISDIITSKGPMMGLYQLHVVRKLYEQVDGWLAKPSEPSVISHRDDNLRILTYWWWCSSHVCVQDDVVMWSWSAVDVVSCVWVNYTLWWGACHANQQTLHIECASGSLMWLWGYQKEIIKP